MNGDIPFKDQFAEPDSGQVLLDIALPWPELSKLAAADQRSRDPVYGVHRWWARRPPAVMRGLLLAATLPAVTTADDYWQAFADPRPRLNGLSAYDPFAGGGSSLVEARRLGMDVAGSDVDPLAALITNFELAPASEAEIVEAGAQLLAHVGEKVADLYQSESGTPLHYFHLREVTCPSCDYTGLLYRNLVIARDLRKRGAVVRDSPLTTFCPTCLTVHHLKDASRVELRCCGRRHRLDAGTFSATRYTCPACGRRSNHTDLRTGVAPLRLIAVEETVKDGRRAIRGVTDLDNQNQALADRRLFEGVADLELPKVGFKTDRHEARPLSYGITKPRSLFSSRQLIALGTAFRWLRDADVSDDAKAGLRLALSNALSTNNLLCGYATDYGRVSALFSIRSYSLPALSVELAPLHPDGGRGTLPKSVSRVARSTGQTPQRHRWSTTHQRPERVAFNFSPEAAPAAVQCMSAARRELMAESFDVCLTDPPYFDFIYYSELSEFHRVWLDLALEDEPLLPSREDGRVESFGSDLGACLRTTVTALRSGRPLIFTYHATSADAWEAVGLALDAAKLSITALWPLRNDAGMGPHSFEGNCQWDVVVVCRRADECSRSGLTVSLDAWETEAVANGLKFRAADRRNIAAALEMASARFAKTRLA